MKLRSAFACAASYVVISVAAGHAYGQATQNTPAAQNSQNPQDANGIETVVVTGVRQSVKSALDIKKNSDQMVDSIVAEDIGKLPDNNVIEALQHVTGVQVSRNAAEADQLLIRGLPDIATLLNGREIFTSTGRFVTLQDIPAELLAGVDVEKTSRADDIEGGIAGLIDVRLHRPFDFDGLEIAGGLQGTYSTLSKQTDPSGSVLLSDRWNTASGEWGLLVDLSYKKDQYKEEILDNYISSQSIGPVPGSTGPGGIAYLPLTQGGQSINGDRQREAANVALQWSPNANTEAFAEVFYTRYRNPNNVDFFVGLPWLGADPATATVFPGTDEVKTVTAGGYDLTSDQSFVPKTDTYQAATGVTWTGQNTTLSTEVDYTDSKFSQEGIILDTEYYPPPGGYTADFDYHGTGTSYMNVTGIDMTDPSQFHIRQLYDQWTRQDGDELDGRADLTYDMGDPSWIKSLVAGVRYVDRFAGNHADNPGGLDCRGVADPLDPDYAAEAAAIASPACFTALSALPGDAAHVTKGKIFDGQFGLTDWTDADPRWLISHASYLRELFDQSPTGAAPPEDPTQTFSDRETSYAGYVKANFGFDLASFPVDGNVGLRIVDTDSDRKGEQIVITPNVPPPATPTSFTFSYVPTGSDKNTIDWLPSLNARLEFQDDLFLRFGASETVTHPTFAQLNPGLSLSSETGTLLASGSEGNPALTPEKSDNLDLSLEYYFGNANALTGAVFYRAVDGYIEPDEFTQTATGVSCNPATSTVTCYDITSLRNAPNGHIDGAEVGYTQFFDFLPGIFSGLGAQANGTYVQGGFANISKWSYNLIGIYEKGPISFRLAYNWRSGFDVGPAPGGGQQPQTIYAKAQPWLDMSVGYRVTDQFTITFDATNMLNSYYQDYFGNPTVDPRDTRRFDQTFVLGVRYRM
jgi:iron complex outermembrane recepter protein